VEERIAIIGAMDEEVEALGHALTSVTQVQSPLRNLPIVQGGLGGKEVVVVRCGIGKVNAALATQYVIDHFKPTGIINSGIAGALSPKVRIGDLVLGTNSLHHDFDLREFGYAMSYIPSLGSSTFTADSRLLVAATQAAKEELTSDRIHQGLIVSGDQFISSTEQKQHISRMFPEAMCAEMEGAAIGQVATINQVPHLIMRAISDLADNTAPDDSDRYILEIIPVLNAVIHRLVALLKD
jgi:adenosylhomocysteine nucleosidase